MARDSMGSRRCTLELEFSHMLSNAQILRIDWPYLNNSFVDARSGKDYLLCSLDPEKHKVFFSIEVCTPLDFNYVSSEPLSSI